MDVDPAVLRQLRHVQDGVVARRQLVDLGAGSHDIRRLLRRRELTSVHPGVYVDHTGPLTRRQREWAAVLACWPAALSHRSALPNSSSTGPIHVAVCQRRTVQAPTGVVVHRTAAFEERVLASASPPRVRLEHAAIDAAAAGRTLLDRFAVLAEVVGTRQTSAARIDAVLRRRRGVPDRALLLDLLADLAAGACSVLEREYLLIERRHGLPTGSAAGRQTRDRVDGASVYRDVDYRPYGVVVELDGRVAHDDVVARDRDARRDLVTLADRDARTVRLTYGLVLRDGCGSVAAIARVLHRQGWAGPFLRCERCPADVDAPSGATG